MGFDDPIQVDEDSRATVELAAGGLVWHDDDTRTLLSVIHRPRHGDWSLPKGRLRPGESLPRAAVREVREETGYEAELRSFAGVTLHHAKGLPKLVLHWHMQVTAAHEHPSEARQPTPPAGGATDDTEVDQVVWLTPAEAVARLTHPEEKQLVEQELSEWRSSGSDARHGRGWWRRIRLGRLWRRIRLERLQREVAVLETQLPRRRLEALNDPVLEQRFEEMVRFSVRARRAADDRRTEDGWAFLQAARQIEVLLYSHEEVQSEGRVLLEEAKEKLSGWRAAAVGKLLGGDGFEAVHVMRAMAIRDENFANSYYKIDLGRRQLWFLLPVALISLLGLVALLTDVFPASWALSLPPLNDPGPAPLEGALVVGVLLAGALGACLSAVLDLARSSAGRIPERFSNWTITLGRIGIGSAAALVVSLFLVTGIGELRVETAGGVLFYSVVAGASERLLKRALTPRE